METTLWTVGRDRHFGQLGGPLGAVDAGSDITAYSLGLGRQFGKLAFGSIEGTARFDERDLGPQQPGERDHATARNLSASAALAHSRNPEDIRHGLEPS
jgi:hypothetical protein